ncbi:TetR/AcrR family transcriptional regulator [Demequina phytophila]|uniref:TetR/AcrR family transcriptional regulator n=1 Tax=Demequina phytophila TaxID=1638981 RepID=UPI0007831A69|nr:TetR family transcriptional regulator C-terminal domain-containing protein [Demequina phytophila]
MPSTTTPASRRLTGTARRAAILEHATALALSDGLAALTLRAVGQRAGVASGLVAHYVDGMDALVAEVFSGISAGERAEVAGVGGIAPLVRTLTDGTREAVTLVWVQAWAAAPGNPVLAAAVRAEMDAWQTMLEARLREAGASDPAPVARALLGMIDGVNAHSLAGWQDRADHAALLLRALEAMLGWAPGTLT